MKKAICICGSPNRNGSTARLLSELSRGMADIGIESQTFYLGEMDIHPCRGCNACRESRRCSQLDGIDALVDALMKADLVCLGSPSYWGDISAQMKAFIDRCMPLCDTQEGGTAVPPGKLGVSVAVRAGRGAAESLKLIGTMEHWFGHLGIRPAARLHAERISCINDLLERRDVLNEAYEIGKGMHGATAEKSPAFSLEAAVLEDVPELAEMNRGLIVDEGSDNQMTLPELEERMKKFLAGEYGGIVIKVDGGAAGYCLFKPEEGHNGGKPGIYLQQYYIKPEYRRIGLGSAALKSVVEEYFTGAAFVSLDVLECNSTGKAFWSSAGFRPVYIRLRRDMTD